MTDIYKVLDKTPQLKEALKKLSTSSVSIGIPENSPNDIRTDTIATNTLIAFVQEFGSPAQNVPAQPFLIPGTEASLKRDTKIIEMGLLKLFKLDGSPQTKIDNMLDEVGLNSQTAVQERIEELEMIVTGQLHDAITHVVNK